MFKDSGLKSEVCGLRSFVFDLAYILFGIFYLPVFLKKIKQADEPETLLRERRGILSPQKQSQLAGKRVIWLHAVSVGEVMAVRPFIEGLLARSSEFHILLTTVTGTGQKIAKGLESPRVSVAYFPFDLSFACRRYLNSVKPECLILAETEIWPNMLAEAARARVRVGIINARLSPRSAGRYDKVRFIFTGLFRKISFVLAQTEEDAERFASLGIPRDRIHTMGNIKFDGVSFEPPDIEALRRNLNLDRSDRVIIAGSTHPGEEDILAKLFIELRNKFKHLKLIIAPRHIERADSLKKEIEQAGLRVRKWTESAGESEDVILLDQLGVLKSVYALAEVVFMGGSLVRHGGQNPIEPAALKKPVLHGPHTFNFEKIYGILDAGGGALEVPDAAGLLKQITHLLEHEEIRFFMGEQAFQIIEKMQGAAQRHLNWIFSFLGPSPKEPLAAGVC